MSIRKRVALEFDAEALITTVEADFNYFDKFGTHYRIVDLKTNEQLYNAKKEPKFYIHRDNGSDVLGIAHLDTVQQDRGCSVVFSKTLGKLVLSGGLDDRLGAYIILEMLPRLGITCDWLLTTDEETGGSTAQYFEGEGKKYNWMFSFDRMGTDVVMYDYRTKELADLVEAAGAHTGHGSISDISYLKNLGISGMNWGCGYQDYHTMRGHAYLFDTFKMVTSFVRFYQQNAETALPWTKPKYNDWHRNNETIYQSNGYYKPGPQDVPFGTPWDDGDKRSGRFEITQDGKSSHWVNNPNYESPYAKQQRERLEQANNETRKITIEDDFNPGIGWSHNENGTWVHNTTGVKLYPHRNPRVNPRLHRAPDPTSTAPLTRRRAKQLARDAKKAEDDIKQLFSVALDDTICPICSAGMIKLDSTNYYCADCDLIPNDSSLALDAPIPLRLNPALDMSIQGEMLG